MIFVAVPSLNAVGTSWEHHICSNYRPRLIINMLQATKTLCGNYIAMNNEEQDVKNILVLQNWLERIRKEVINKALSIKRISDFLIFPILAQPTLKKI